MKQWTWNWSALYTEHFVIAIPDNVCSAVCWAAGAAIGYLSAEAGYWIVEKIAGKKKKKVDGVVPSDDEQKVQIGVSPDGLAMVIKL